MTDEWFSKICNVKRSEVQLCFCLFSFPWSVDLCTFDSTTLHSLGFGFGFFWGVPGESGTGGDFVFFSLNQTPDPGSRKKWNLRVTTCLISTERIPTHPSHQFSLSPSSREATWWAYMPNGAQGCPSPSLCLEFTWKVDVSDQLPALWDLGCLPAMTIDGLPLIKPHCQLY